MRPRWRSKGRRRSTTHPQDQSAAEDGGRQAFLSREEWAQPRGRKCAVRRCGQSIEAQPSPARSAHQETVWGGALNSRNKGDTATLLKRQRSLNNDSDVNNHSRLNGSRRCFPISGSARPPAPLAIARISSSQTALTWPRWRAWLIPASPAISPTPARRARRCARGWSARLSVPRDLHSHATRTWSGLIAMGR